MDGRKNWSKHFIRLGLVVGIVVLFFVVSAVHRETEKKKQIQTEIDKLRAESEKISRQNALLQEKIGFLGSREYMETEARDKLSLRSPDEKLVIVKKNVVKENTEEIIPSKDIPVIEKEKVVIENHLKWWNYFFKY